MKKLLRQIKKILKKINQGKSSSSLSRAKKIESYFKGGKIPWSDGYAEYKWDNISKSISDVSIIECFKNNNLPQNYGVGLDERIVEYPWIVSNLKNENSLLLDAGSTFNFQIILQHPLVSKKSLSIYTYSPERNNFNEKRISYLYGDLRDLPFRDNLFEEIVCQSTIEHIDMDNNIYGYDINNNSKEFGKSFEYLKAIDELLRVLKPNGVLLLTFPYGLYENHGFFQQFDKEMVERISSILKIHGRLTTDFYKYFKEGWNKADQSTADDSHSFNPHTGKGKSDDGAAHCRAVCCIKFIKE